MNVCLLPSSWKHSMEVVRIVPRISVYLHLNFDCFHGGAWNSRLSVEMEAFTTFLQRKLPQPRPVETDFSFHRSPHFHYFQQLPQTIVRPREYMFEIQHTFVWRLLSFMQQVVNNMKVIFTSMKCCLLPWKCFTSRQMYFTPMEDYLPPCRYIYLRRSWDQRDWCALGGCSGFPIYFCTLWA